MLVTELFFISLIFISVYISYTDIKQRRIPNSAIGIIFLLGILYILSSTNDFPIYRVLVILIAGVGLSYLNILGAGDSKLFAAMSVFISSEYFPVVVILILLLGGALTFFQLVMVLITGNRRWVARGVPYGVPICIACLVGFLASV